MGNESVRGYNRIKKVVLMPKQRMYDNEETSHLSVRLPVSLLNRIMDRSSKNRRSINQEIVLLLQASLEAMDRAPEPEDIELSHPF